MLSKRYVRFRRAKKENEITTVPAPESFTLLSSSAACPSSSKAITTIAAPWALQQEKCM